MRILQIIALVGLVIFALAIIGAVQLRRRERNSTTNMLKYCSLLFGILFLIDCIGFIAIFLITGFNIVWLISGSALTFLLLWIVVGYPLFFIVGTVGAHISYRKGHIRACRIFMFLPLLSLVPLAVVWIIIGIHALV